MKRPALVVVLAMLAVFLLVIIYIGNLKGIGQVTPVFVNNDLIFEIDYRYRTNGIIELIIIDTANSKTIWDISLRSFRGASLKYGEIPQDFETFNGATNSAKQDFPVTGKPLGLVEGKIYELYTDWQYDTFVAAAAESKSEYFKIENKEIVFVKNPSLNN
ncbi:MAG: hypothetical protein IH984_02235 [Planctomycetes bacterium]|nr:hypothetical protein [Planctomycetota bacterium]